MESFIVARVALCHTDRTHSAKGFCRPCYDKNRDPATRNAQIARWKQNNPDKAKAIYRRRDLKKLGTTLSEYERLYAAQRGCCKICDRWQKTLTSDHCHLTGKFRGLICGPCNRAIGLLQDSPELLHKAAQYLRGT